MAVKYLDAKRLQGLSTDITATLGYNEPDAGNENATLIANYAGGKTHRGQIWTTGHAMIGQKPQKVVVTLKKRGSPTGTMRVVIVKDSDKSQIDIGTKDISTLTTSMASYTFENTSQSYALVSGDGVFLEFSDTSGTNNSGNGLDPYVGYSSAGTYTQYAWKLYTGGVWDYDGSANQPMLVYGSPPTFNLPSGTIFSTTDTYKYYWWNGTDTWSLSG